MNDRKKEAKNNLIKMLDESIDPVLLKLGFKRRKGALTYKRKLPESIQEIEFLADYFPKYEYGAEMHIRPFFVWKIPPVSEKALKLVNGNKMLLANAPDLLIRQPIEFSVPNEHHERWFTKSFEDYHKVGISISSFIETWLVDLCNKTQTINDLLSTYELSNASLLKQQHWYVFVIAAYILQNEPEKAKSVIEKHLSKQAFRRIYSSVHENLM